MSIRAGCTSVSMSQLNTSFWHELSPQCHFIVFSNTRAECQSGMAVKSNVVLSPLRQTFFICVSQYIYEGMALCDLMVVVSISL